MYEGNDPVAGDIHLDAVAQLGLTADASVGLLAYASDADGEGLLVAYTNPGVTFEAADGVIESAVDLPAYNLDAPYQQVGTFDFAEDGGFAFHPDPTVGFVGRTGFDYAVTDGTAYSNTAHVVIDVHASTVHAEDDAYRVRTNGFLPVSIESGLLANDYDTHTDPAGTIRPLRVDLSMPTFNTAHGTVTLLDEAGSFSYTSEPGYEGADSFTYTVIDADGNAYPGEPYNSQGLAQAYRPNTVTIDVYSDAPIGVADAYVLLPGEVITLDLLANDNPTGTDPAPTIDVATLTQHSGWQGTLVAIDAAQGMFQYTAPVDWRGQASLSYQLTDGVENSEPIEVTISVLDDALAAVADFYSFPIGSDYQASAEDGVLSNDIGGASVLTASVATAIGGVFTFQPDGAFTYDRGGVAIDDLTADTAEYRVVDATGSVIATGTVTVQVTNTAPSAGHLEQTVVEDGSVVVGFIGDDPDPADTTLIFELVGEPAHGSFDPGTNTYTPDADFFGDEALSYTVTDSLRRSATGTVLIHVTPTNDAPAVDPATLTTHRDQTLRVDLSPYVSDSDGDTLSYTLANALPGATVSTDGKFSYTPAEPAGKMLLGELNQGLDVYDSDSTNPAFILYSAEDVHTRFSANPPSAGNSDHLVVVRYDAQGGWQYNAGGSAWHGFAATGGDRLLVLLDLGNNLTYTLTAGQGTLNGIDYGYLLGDLSVVMEVYDNQPDAGEIQVTGTYFTTQAQPSLQALVDVSDGSAITRLTLDLALINSAPAGVADTYHTTQDQPLSISSGAGVLANDSDDQPDRLRAVGHAVQLATSQGGVVSLRPDGGFDYTPPAGLDNLTDSFTYTPMDGYASGAATTVSIVIEDVDAVLRPDRYQVQRGGTLNVTADQGVLRNDFSDSGALTVDTTQTVAPAAGTLDSLATDGAFTYHAPANQLGEQTLTYYVKVGSTPLSIPVTVTIQVLNTAPVAVNDSYDVIANALSSDGHAISRSGVLGEGVIPPVVRAFRSRGSWGSSF